MNDTPDTKFYFESQKFGDIPPDRRPSVENLKQFNDWGAQEVRDNNALIDAAAKRYSIDPDIVRAILYTEVSRGWYGYHAEFVHMADTILPGNVSSDWQQLIPGSDVKKRQDNIEVATKLIAQIAKRLDDPSIENIYSLYNSLSHDRTYVNKDVKSTPYFAKLALEAKAWEKDGWSAPEFPKDASAVAPVGSRQVIDARFGNWAVAPVPGQPPSQAFSPSFSDRFGDWASVPGISQDERRSSITRELMKYWRPETASRPQWPGSYSTAPILPSVQPGLLNGDRSAAQSDADSAGDAQSARSDPTIAKQERYLRGRLVDRSGRTVFEVGAPPVPFVRSGPMAPRASLPQSPGDENPSASSDADIVDWYVRRVKSLQQN